MVPVEIKNGRALIFLNPREAKEREEMNENYLKLRDTLIAKGFTIGLGSKEEEAQNWIATREQTKDLSRDGIVAKLISLKNLSESEDSDCILVAVIGHGGRKGLSGMLEEHEMDKPFREVILVKDKKMMCVEDIWEPFLDYEKPKIFLVKACRGKEHDKGIVLTRDDSRDVPDIPELKKDFLIFRSSPAGYPTVLQGDPFIRKFCEVLNSNDPGDLTALMTEVNYRTAREERKAYKDGEPITMMQMPEIQSTMTKPIRLMVAETCAQPILETRESIVPQNGKALIFGGNGAHEDLKDILTELGFNVEPKDNISSLSRDAIKVDLWNLRTKSEEQEADCVLVAMTAKGRRKRGGIDTWPEPDGRDQRHLLYKEVIHTEINGEDLSMEEILDQFQDSPALADKPKIFLIQIQEEHCDKTPPTPPRGDDGDTPDKVSKEADFLIYRLRSAGSGEEGNFFLRSISKVLRRAKAESDASGTFKQDFMPLLTQVNQEVSDANEKLIPVIVSRLTKPIYFKQTQKEGEVVGLSRDKI